MRHHMIGWRLGKTSAPLIREAGSLPVPPPLYLRERQGANGKTNVPPKPCSVFARRRSVGSIPTFRTRGAQTPRFRSGVPQYAVAVRRSTGFSSFFPAPVGIQAGQLLSNGGAVRGRQPRRPYGALAQSAEQAAHNGPVPGSSPRCPTSRKAKNLHKKRKKGGTFQ